jgi:CopA family copper-resistance protein
MPPQKEYHLEIARKEVTISGEHSTAIAINGEIPGPVLQFTEGDEAVIAVTNHLDEDTSVHWHGLLVSGDMDGAPGFNGFDGIQPQETFTYRFPVRQSGTYWYHAHSGGQEQEGLYGAIVISPKTASTPVITDKVVLLSDFTPEKPMTIMNHLKADSGWYNHAQRTVGDFMDDVKARGFDAAWVNARDWGHMRMSQTDLADVTGYTFLTNGKKLWETRFKKGEKVKLRFINASAMTMFDVRIPDLKMTVVEADGQPVEPVVVDEFRFAPAETYDVIVQPTEDKAYPIVSESMDRTGFAMGVLAPRAGMAFEPPIHRKRALLTMADMDMANMMEDNPDMDMSGEGVDYSGWAETGTPEGQKALSYEDLKSLKPHPKITPTREIDIELGGNMERYIWTLNGKKMMDAPPIEIGYGEQVRINLNNVSMMAHPFHLHGMFVQLENGQDADRLPSKHTVIVPPAQSVSLLLSANEAGEWPAHCHLLYHMLSGMMTKVVVK